MWYPKAERRPQTNVGGSQYGGPSRGVLHTTETKSWAGAPYYHIEYNPTSHTFRQYRSFDRSAYGLRHPTSTPQTNRQGDHCAQVAVTEYARNSADWDNQTYSDLAELIAWLNDECGIQAYSRYPVGHGGSAYGEQGTARMGWDEWLEYNGWCAHQEVPANTHWDAGRVDWLRLLGEEELTPEQEASLEWLEVNKDFLDAFIVSTTDGVAENDPDGNPSGPTFPEFLIPWYRHGRRDLENQVAKNTQDIANGDGGSGEINVETTTIEVVTGVTVK